ncbi:thioredoxin-related transmembrane protein 4 [Drosophila simulans]|uniref:GD14338 n=1 Tax=Drosophila simulans TaxID=7240 RepID=B4QQP9_DROSI|nr:thioredoxin-related transmembrane protein 4 [Drosophila simulans]EDX10151.1 GD14338 [Drosophila simulans]KMY99109.1 uncharacterized protein Dsimw501_GD14338 [Drosophila simulans]
MTSKLILLLSVFGVIPNAMLPKSPVNIDVCPRSSRKSETSYMMAEYGDGLITRIDEGNWKEVLSGEWLLLLCSSHRPKCGDWKAVLYQLASTSMGCLDVDLAFGDLSTNFWLRGRFSAFREANVYHVLDGEFRRLSSSQDTNSLHNLLLLREWSEIPPMSLWLHPTSKWSTFAEIILKTTMDLKHLDIFGRNAWKTALILDLIFFIVTPYILWLSIMTSTENMVENDDTLYEFELAPTKTSIPLFMKSTSKFKSHLIYLKKLRQMRESKFKSI